MATNYFSDRESGQRPRSAEEFTPAAWGGVVALAESLISTGAYGIDFPDGCSDGLGPVGTNAYGLQLAVRAEIPDLPWPLDATAVPPTLPILDFIEFTHNHIAEPRKGTFHKFFGHYHLTYERAAGQADFRQRINRILGRNGLAYQLTDDGQVQRVAPPVLSEALGQSAFSTGEAELDRLLESARRKFLSPDLETRREALEKLWDAWERLKTLLHPEDKKKSASALLDKAAPEGKMRSALAAEAAELTRIGNEFRIRHSEMNKAPIESSAQVDYLFHRMFSMIQLLLKAL